jgi:hypothetical protein
MPKDGKSRQSTVAQLGRFSTWEIAIKLHQLFHSQVASSYLLYESSAQQVTHRCNADAVCCLSKPNSAVLDLSPAKYTTKAINE